MPDKSDKEKRKEPIEMTTDEALDYVFGSEIADALRKEVASKDEPPDDCDQSND